MNAHTAMKPVQAGLPHLVAHAHAAALRLDDACRAGVDLPGEEEFGKLEGAALDARQQVRSVIEALGINPDMLAKVLS